MLSARWRHAWPGLVATLSSVGISRFAYGPLVPFLIASGLLTASGAAYLGAANVMGYLVGALIATWVGARLGAGTGIRVGFALTALSLALCVWSGGFWWYFPWRFLSGVTAAIIMVLAPSYILGTTALAERGRTGGIIYTGVGTGIALSSLIVPPLAAHSIPWAWAALALAALAGTLATWPVWRNRPVPAIPPGHAAKTRMSLPVWLIILPYGLDAFGVVPHMLFWVDYVARELGQGMGAGALQWLLFGLGGLAGPILAGKIGDRVGLGVGLIGAFAIKALLVAMPAYFTGSLALSISSLLVGGISPGVAALAAGRMGELLPLHLQARALGRATLSYGVFQAIVAYGMSYLYGLFGSYLWLFVIGGLGEALCAILAYASYVMANKRAAGINA